MLKRTMLHLVTSAVSLWPIISGLGQPAAAADANPASELATDWVAGHKSRTRLSIGVDGAGPAPSHSPNLLYAFVEIQLAEGWKTYWRSPGDSGIPPKFDFSGSRNLLKATDFYPAPKRITDKGETIIGYTGTVIFPVLLERKDQAQALDLKAVVQFGMCKDICVPTEAQFELSIPPMFNGAPTPEASASIVQVPYNGAATDEVPHVTKVSAGKSIAEKKLTLTAQFPAGTDGADAFLEAPDGAYLPLVTQTSKNGKDVTFEADLSTDVDVAALKGKTIIVTLVSKAASAETSFKFE